MQTEGPLLAELRVKDALLATYQERDKWLFKQIKVLTAITRTPRMYTELRRAIDRRFETLAKNSVGQAPVEELGHDESRKKVRRFFDYCCLLVLSGGNEKIKFESNIWDTFDEVDSILK